jgi:hypothetical protein
MATAASALSNRPKSNGSGIGLSVPSLPASASERRSSGRPLTVAPARGPAAAARHPCPAGRPSRGMKATARGCRPSRMFVTCPLHARSGGQASTAGQARRIRCEAGSDARDKPGNDCRRRSRGACPGATKSPAVGPRFEAWLLDVLPEGELLSQAAPPTGRVAGAMRSVAAAAGPVNGRRVRRGNAVSLAASRDGLRPQGLPRIPAGAMR